MVDNLILPLMTQLHQKNIHPFFKLWNRRQRKSSKTNPLLLFSWIHVWNVCKTHKAGQQWNVCEYVPENNVSQGLLYRILHVWPNCISSLLFLSLLTNVSSGKFSHHFFDGYDNNLDWTNSFLPLDSLWLHSYTYFFSHSFVSFLTHLFLVWNNLSLEIDEWWCNELLDSCGVFPHYEMSAPLFAQFFTSFLLLCPNTPLKENNLYVFFVYYTIYTYICILYTIACTVINHGKEAINELLHKWTKKCSIWENNDAFKK